MIQEDELTSTFGYARELWRRAKREAREHLIRVAHSGDVVGYAELAREVKSINFDPHGTIFRKFLGQLSTEEDAGGRGMITAIVVRKDTGLPGGGFFRLAKRLGRDVSDQVKCWSTEVQRVFRDWQQAR